MERQEMMATSPLAQGRNGFPAGVLGLRIDRLMAFSAVADLGSFTAAGTRLGYDQSQVSRQVAELERVLGTRLIDRGLRPIALTASGQQVLPSVRAVMRELGELSASVAS
jgi:DNA-binding transcriptional LysR family regulator